MTEIDQQLAEDRKNELIAQGVLSSVARQMAIAEQIGSHVIVVGGMTTLEPSQQMLADGVEYERPAGAKELNVAGAKQYSEVVKAVTSGVVAQTPVVASPQQQQTPMVASPDWPLIETGKVMSEASNDADMVKTKEELIDELRKYRKYMENVGSASAMARNDDGYGQTLRASGAPRLLMNAPDPQEINFIDALRKYAQSHPYAMQGMNLFNPATLWDFSGSPEATAWIEKTTGLNETRQRMIRSKVISTGASAALFGMTGNFPVSAMGYFALDRINDPNTGKELFTGAFANNVTLDGLPLTPIGVEIPDALPNEIFADYRFICYDRLTGKMYPTDEVQALNYTGGTEEYRWLCLDRLSGRVLHANKIKRIRIYVD